MRFDNLIQFLLRMNGYDLCFLELAHSDGLRQINSANSIAKLMEIWPSMKLPMQKRISFKQILIIRHTIFRILDLCDET